MGGGRGVTRRQLQGTFWNDGNSLHLDEGREGLLHEYMNLPKLIKSYMSNCCILLHIDCSYTQRGQ